MTERLRLPGAPEAVEQYNLTLEARFGPLASETLRTGLSILAQTPEDCSLFFVVLTTIMNDFDPEIREVGAEYIADVHDDFTNPLYGHGPSCPLHHDEVLFYQIHDN